MLALIYSIFIILHHFISLRDPLNWNRKSRVRCHLLLSWDWTAYKLINTLSLPHHTEWSGRFWSSAFTVSSGFRFIHTFDSFTSSFRWLFRFTHTFSSLTLLIRSGFDSLIAWSHSHFRFTHNLESRILSITVAPLLPSPLPRGGEAGGTWISGEVYIQHIFSIVATRIFIKFRTCFMTQEENVLYEYEVPTVIYRRLQ